MSSESSVSTHMLRILMRALVADGVLSDESLLAAADEIDASQIEEAKMAAHLVRWDIVRPTLEGVHRESRRVEQLRSMMRIVPSSRDGGNDDS